MLLSVRVNVAQCARAKTVQLCSEVSTINQISSSVATLPTGADAGLLCFEYFLSYNQCVFCKKLQTLALCVVIESFRILSTK